MSLLSPVSETLRGLKTYADGCRWLAAHPRHAALLAIPSLVGLACMIGGVGLFATHDEAVMAQILFARPEGFLALALWYLCKILVYVAAIVFTFVASLLVANVVSSPVYEVVSTAIETDVTGVKPANQSLGEMLKVMVVELQKVIAILVLSVALLLIPGLNILASLVAAFLVGWNFFDYPLARRGWTFRERLGLVKGEGFAILGLGLLMIIPFASIVLAPAGVAGGTLLNLEALKKRHLLTRESNALAHTRSSMERN